MKLHINKTRVIGTLLGIAFVGAFATMQFIFVYGFIEARNYMIPIILGTIIGYVLSSIYDRLNKAKQELAEQHDRLQLVLEATNIGIWDWNPQTDEVYFDEGWCELLGYTQDEITPTLESWKSRVHPNDIADCYVDIQKHMEGKVKHYSNIHRMKHKEGHWVYILDRGQIIERNELGEPIRFTGTHIDVTHLKEVERELEEKNLKLQELTLIDGLTGLKNRRALDDYLPQQWSHFEREHTPFCILMIDIDFFKDFNDFYGHLQGDKCLQQIADILKTHAHRVNDIAVRYGGEEFLIAYSGMNQEQGLKVAETLRAEIEALGIPHEKSDVAKVVTVSIGVFACDEKDPCSSMLQPIDNADQALYLAKQRGRNRVSGC